MPQEEECDLSELLGDTLSLENIIRAPARFSKKPDYNDRYKNLMLQDPYELLGEREFSRRENIPECVKGTPIQEFYRGKNVFITGATGFVGTILTEKLIRSVPHIGHIYLLIRAKRGKSSKERFEHLLENKVFRRMRTEVPEYAAKMTAVDGDIGLPGLGLSPADRRTLADRVHVVFHGAADVRFIEPIRTAVNSNLVGSRRVLQLAKEMKELHAYVHVSTAYSQCVNRLIEENVPRLNVRYQEVIDYIATKTDDELIEETPRLLEGWPNTYTFSKALCEEMVNEEAKDIPTCIVRPSVVTPTYKEPVRGWTDNLYGPMGVLVGTGHGVIHCFRMPEDLAMDLVPVDYVVNCMLAAAWSTAVEGSKRKDNLKVYNFTSTSVTPGTYWKVVTEFLLSLKDVFPYSRSVWYTSFFYTESKYLEALCWYLLHRIPGFFLDKLAELTGGKPVLSKIYRKVESLKGHSDFFIFTHWDFKSDNVMELWKSLGEDDQKIFYFDVRDVDFKEHLTVSKVGTRYYYEKDAMESIPAAMRKNKWLYWLHNGFLVTCSLLALKLMVVTARALPF